MIPEPHELARMDFRQVMDRVHTLNTAELDTRDPVDLLEANWFLLEEVFRDGFLAQWRTLSSAEWSRCGQLADKLATLAETYGGIEHVSMTYRRFHLFTQLLLEAGPRTEVPLTNPDQLLRHFLDGFPYSLEEAELRVATRSDDLHQQMLMLAQTRRVEHLFPPSADLDEYRAWQDLWARVTGIPESEQAPWPRGGRTP